MHNLGRSVALALAVASLPSALVGGWSALVSEPHCERLTRWAEPLETRILCSTGRRRCLVWETRFLLSL